MIWISPSPNSVLAFITLVFCSIDLSIYKALHGRELMTEDDRTDCVYAVKAACLLPIALSMPQERRHLIPHMFSWTQNFLAIVLILRLCEKGTYIGGICENGGITDADIEKSIGLMVEWLKGVSQVDGIADWSLRVLGPSMSRADLDLDQETRL
jgi:hypothetical protein